MSGTLRLGLGGRRGLVRLVLFSSAAAAALRGSGSSESDDPLDLGLDLEDAHLDFLGGLDDIGDPAHARRRELGDVDQALDARLELDERAEVHDLRDLSLDHRPAGVFLGDVLPRAGRELLEAERELARGLVDLEHLDLHLVADLDQVVDLGDARPAHLADRQQAVDAAEVDERAEVFDRPDDAVADLAFFEGGPGLLALLGALLLQQLAAGDDQVLLALVGLGDDGLELLVQVAAASSTRDRSIWLIGRKPRMPSTSTSRPPLTILVTRASTMTPRLRFSQLASIGRPLQAEDLDAFVGVEPFDDDLDGRARRGDLLAFELVDRQDALALAAEVDEDATCRGRR